MVIIDIVLLSNSAGMALNVSQNTIVQLGQFIIQLKYTNSWWRIGADHLASELLETVPTFSFYFNFQGYIQYINLIQ